MSPPLPEILGGRWDVRRCSLSRPEQVHSVALLGSLFHQVFEQLTGPGPHVNLIAPLQLADATLESWQQTLKTHVDGNFVAPTLRTHQANLQVRGAEGITYCTAVKPLCDWIVAVLVDQRGDNEPLERLRARIFEAAEQEVSVELRDPSWGDNDLLKRDTRVHSVAMGPAPGALEMLVDRLNALQARGLLGEHAIGGAMAFVYWAEPFETKDLDVFAILPTTAAGLIHLAPIWDYLVAHGGTPEGEFIRLGRLLLDFVPASDALDEEAIAEAVSVRIGDDMTRVFTPEHAVAIALRTWRGKDREHIDRLIRTGRRPLDMARLHGILQRYGLVERWRRFKEMYDVDLG